LDEVHKKPYSGHPGYQKTVTTLRKLFYWPNMKGETTKYLAKCQDCQQVKVETLASSRPVAALTCAGMEMGDYITGLYYRFA
jgi:hypothetical protein